MLLGEYFTGVFFNQKHKAWKPRISQINNIYENVGGACFLQTTFERLSFNGFNEGYLWLPYDLSFSQELLNFPKHTVKLAELFAI